MSDLRGCAAVALVLAAGCTAPGAPERPDALEIRVLGGMVNACEPISGIQVVALSGAKTLTSFTGPLTLSIATGTGVPGAVLSGERTVVAEQGVARFDGLSINAAGSAYRLRAASDGLDGITSAFDVIPGGAYRLVFTANPTFVSTSLQLPLVRVVVRDACGGPIPGSTLPVSLFLSANSVSATLGGTTTRNAIDGVASFLDLALSRPGAGLTLGATSPGLMSATTAAFTIAAPPGQ